MRDLVRRYLDHSLSRRDFAAALRAMGFTAAAARAILAPLQASEEAAKTGAPGAHTLEGTGGELVVAQARAAGVEYLFTNPGSYEVAFFDAWIDKPDLRLIMGLHEGIVVSMADGYHRVSGKPGFVNVHVIAGTAQMAGQLYNASRDGSALVITAGLNDNELWSDETLLAPRPGFDQKEVVRQFTKISWEARNAASLPLMLRRAFKVAATEPGGPVYLAMAHHALETRAARAEILPSERFLLRSRVRPEAAAVEQAAKLLIEAKRPLVLAGDEIWKSRAQQELVSLAELLGTAVTDGSDAYRNFPVKHPQYAGRFALTSPLVKGVDVVLCAGARDFGGKVAPRAPEAPQAKIIRLGIDTASMGRNYPTDVALIGDARETLRDLRLAIESQAVKSKLASLRQTRSAEVREVIAAARSRAQAVARKNFGASPMHPDEIGAVVAGAIEPDAIFVTENLTGRHDAFSFGFREKEHVWIGNTGASLGWGVGAATGAKLAAPDRQVICSIGDGSLMYSASGFWSQARYGVPVLTVVWNNKNYQTVRLAYHGYQGNMAKTGHYAGMYLGDPDIDFVKLAESQGVKGEKAGDAASLAAALKRGAAATRDGKPYLIEVAAARYGGGAASTWHEGFNLAARRTRKV
jgi:benzoylformate decarboxylase